MRMSRRSILRRLALEARPYYPRIVVATLLGALAGVLTLVPPAAFRTIINRVLAPKSGAQPDLHALALALIATFAALVLANIATYSQTYLTAWSGQHLVARLRVRLFERLLNLPLSEFDKWRPGELLARFSADLTMMTDAVSVSLPQLVVALVTFVSSFATMVYLDWLLTCSLLIVAPLVSFAVSTFQRLITTSTQRAQARIADLSANLTEILQGQRVVKAFGREEFEVSRFQTRNDDFFGAYMKLTQFMQTQVPVVAIIIMLSVTGMLLFSTHEVLVGRMNSGEVFRFWTLVALAINPMNRFAIFFADFQKAIVGAGRVYEILDLPVERGDIPGAVPLGSVRGDIRYENVTFAYRPEEGAVLDAFSAEIAAGEIVALVGPSGAGKTTIANLVPRFFEPQSGRITIDGIDLKTVRLVDLRSAIALVPQETQLFSGTIADNIRYGRLDAGDDEILTAAKIANADEFIERLSDGYATLVGERGIRLSGGQRARIAIARAVVRNPRILILDEATSALDSHSEALIEQAFDRILPGRTTIIIAHRLSTIRRASKILYIERGRVRETGTHESLLASGGAYAALHRAQH